MQIMANLPKLAEWHIDGSESQGRFAIHKPEKPLRYVNLTEDNLALEDSPYFLDITMFTRQMLFKHYELKVHLGNIFQFSMNFH